MNDAQSTVVGLKAQECPAGGWNGMPRELEGMATVADCLTDGSCGCIYGDAVKHIERLISLESQSSAADCPKDRAMKPLPEAAEFAAWRSA